MKNGSISKLTIAILDVPGKGESFALTDGKNDLYVGRFGTRSGAERIAVGTTLGQYTHITSANELFDTIRKFSEKLKETGGIEDLLNVEKPVEKAASA